jgi:Cof subfamily protein (haloacid dehalogenase superfamily)
VAERGYTSFMATPYRLLFLDIDGTLVGATGIMTPRTQEALHQAQQRGCTLVICTGRNRHAAQRIAVQIGGHGYGIVLNGALVFDWATGAVLRRALLPLPVAQEAVRIAHRLEIAPIWMGTEERDNHLVTDRRAPLWPRYAERNAERLVYCDDLAAEMPGPPASLAAYGTPEKTAALAAAWRRAFGARVHAIHAITAPYGSWYAQLNDASADKGLAAQAVAEALGVPREQTLAIGDHVNDLALLRWAGLGVCMGGGHPDALACADHVTGTLEEDGVAQAIERWVLMPSTAGRTNRPAPPSG